MDSMPCSGAQQMKTGLMKRHTKKKSRSVANNSLLKNVPVGRQRLRGQNKRLQTHADERHKYTLIMTKPAMTFHCSKTGLHRPKRA